MPKYLLLFLSGLLVFTAFGGVLSAQERHVLYTTDGSQYVGKMVDFRYETILFNVYKLGKAETSTLRIPISKIWKIEFTSVAPQRIQSSFEIEQKYQKFRRNKRSRTLELKAQTPWLDTGLVLQNGQEIMFSSSGSINIDSRTAVFQDGEANLTWNKKKTMPTQPTGALIARVGEDGAPFYVGNNRAPMKMSRAGRLFIGINDFVFTDNTGSFSVTIYH
jgi:hypothetical protein